MRVSDRQRGSAPLELILWVSILLLTLLPTLELQRALTGSMAAEAIARHALRAGVLGDVTSSQWNLERQVEVAAYEIAASYQISPERMTLTVDCSNCDSDELIRLAVEIDSQRVVALMGLAVGAG